MWLTVTKTTQMFPSSRKRIFFQEVLHPYEDYFPPPRGRKSFYDTYLQLLNLHAIFLFFAIMHISGHDPITQLLLSIMRY